MGRQTSSPRSRTPSHTVRRTPDGLGRLLTKPLLPQKEHTFTLAVRASNKRDEAALLAAGLRALALQIEATDRISANIEAGVEKTVLRTFKS